MTAALKQQGVGIQTRESSSRIAIQRVGVLRLDRNFASKGAIA